MTWHNSIKYQRELKQLKKFGAKHFLQKNQKHSQLSTLRQSLLSTASSELENTIVGSIIDSTITIVNNEVSENSRIASETLKNWPNIEVQNCQLVCDFYTPRSNKGKDANLASMLMRKHQKSTKGTIVGNNFKMLQQNWRKEVQELHTEAILRDNKSTSALLTTQELCWKNKRQHYRHTGQNPILCVSTDRR